MHTSGIHNNAVHEMTLIKMTVTRLMGRVCFLIIYSNQYMK